MTLDYDQIWSTMNELESVTSKICSAREILDSAINALENHKLKKTESLLYAVDGYLQYYLQEFDTKFKDAWNETVTKVKQQDINDCMPPWRRSAMEALRYTDAEMKKMCDTSAKQDKVVRWQLPVERKIEDGIDDYYIQFPDDLLEAANLKPGDEVEWISIDDHSYLLRKSINNNT